MDLVTILLKPANKWTGREGHGPIRDNETRHVFEWLESNVLDPLTRHAYRIINTDGLIRTHMSPDQKLDLAEDAVQESILLAFRYYDPQPYLDGLIEHGVARSFIEDQYYPQFIDGNLSSLSASARGVLGSTVVRLWLIIADDQALEPREDNALKRTQNGSTSSSLHLEGLRSIGTEEGGKQEFDFVYCLIVRGVTIDVFPFQPFQKWIYKIVTQQAGRIAKAEADRLRRTLAGPLGAAGASKPSIPYPDVLPHVNSLTPRRREAIFLIHTLELSHAQAAAFSTWPCNEIGMRARLYNAEHSLFEKMLASPKLEPYLVRLDAKMREMLDWCMVRELPVADAALRFQPSLSLRDADDLLRSAQDSALSLMKSEVLWQPFFVEFSSEERKAFELCFVRGLLPAQAANEWHDSRPIGDIEQDLESAKRKILVQMFKERPLQVFLDQLLEKNKQASEAFALCELQQLAPEQACNKSQWPCPEKDMKIRAQKACEALGALILSARIDQETVPYKDMLKKLSQSEREAFRLCGRERLSPDKAATKVKPLCQKEEMEKRFSNSCSKLVAEFSAGNFLFQSPQSGQVQHEGGMRP